MNVIKFKTSISVQMALFVLLAYIYGTLLIFGEVYDASQFSFVFVFKPSKFSKICFFHVFTIFI